MRGVVEYLKRELKQPELVNWEEIRTAYLERACQVVAPNWQSPSYLTSLESQAGRRTGEIKANINDYTRDHHDLARYYEAKFAHEYLPWKGLLGIDPYVFVSGMAALQTIVTAIHQLYGVGITVAVGERSYFQNRALLKRSFARVIYFDEKVESSWRGIMTGVEEPRVIFVDSLCNESELTMPPLEKQLSVWKCNRKSKIHVVVDNSMLGVGLPWKQLLKKAGWGLEVVGWESLNKYHQFGLDRTTGGIAWGTGEIGKALFQARMQAGTIMPDINVAMLPSPNHRVMRKYLLRIEQNRRLWEKELKQAVVVPNRDYEFSGAQLVTRQAGEWSYRRKQAWIRRVVSQAKAAKLQLVAGTSFGMPNTRIYVTKKDNLGTPAFVRVSVGTEETETTLALARLVKQNLR